MKVLSIFGTRPEAIKMCPVIKELDHRDDIDSVVCLTGQHEEMLSQVMELFGIEAKYNLHIMKRKQTLSMITTEILIKADKVYEIEKPDLVLVHGDTSTSFAGALAAFYRGIPVGHVEAGLRTYNIKSPYPEEFNRQAVDLMSDLYFAPTKRAKEQLLKEGKKKEKIFVTGNTVIDALKTTVTKDYMNPILSWASDSKLLLVTAHRRENIGQPMENMFRAIVRIVDANRDVKVVYPIHKNPMVREIAERILGNHERIKVIEPLDVFEFHNFMARCFLVLTDSGGVQEEAPSLGKPVLVMRDTTERPEGVVAGTLRLVGTEEEAIYKEAVSLLNNQSEYQKMSCIQNPYGDGHAAERIADIIVNILRRRLKNRKMSQNWQ